MAKFPAFTIWTDSYLSDTRHLNASQHGAHLLLLMTAWRTNECGIPDDDEKLAMWAAMDKRTWLKNKPVVMALNWFIGPDGLWHQKRLDDERNLAEVRLSSAVQAGRASALKRQKRHSTPVDLRLNASSTSPAPTPNILKLASKINVEVFNREKINLAKKGDPAYDPELICGSLLPGGWFDYAISRNVSPEQTYASWGVFLKKVNGGNIRRSRWTAWIDGEKI